MVKNNWATYQEGILFHFDYYEADMAWANKFKKPKRHLQSLCPGQNELQEIKWPFF